MNIKPFPESENITPIAVPVPGLSNLITVNLYALGKGPITLIDTCLKAPGTLEYVGTALRKAGLDIADVERIIITHGHMDHFGLASAIRKAVNHPVECFVHVEDRWQISSENFGKEMWSEEANALMAMAGMPLEEKEKVRKRFAAFREMGDPLDEVSVFEEGREFEGDGYRLKVIHTPGHTPGSCCIYECGQKILFSGDTLIKHITPNPLVVIKTKWTPGPWLQKPESLFAVTRQACRAGHKVRVYRARGIHPRLAKPDFDVQEAPQGEDGSYLERPP